MQELIQQGLRAHQSGRVSEAKSLYNQALEIEPRHPDALHLAGVATLQEGDAAGAIALIRKAVEVQPGNPAFHGNLAQAYLALKQHSDALAAYLRAQALDPRNPQFAVGAANCLALQGQFVEAEQRLRAVTLVHPAFALAWNSLGNVVMELGRAEEAAGAYARAMHCDPDLADAGNNLGRALHALGRFEEAERAYRGHLSGAPGSMAGQVNLASLLIDRGRFEEAADECRVALRAHPESAELFMLIGAARVHQGRFVEALEAFRRAAEIEPQNPRMQWAHGYALNVMGDRVRGLPLMKRALEAQADSPTVRDAMASIYLSTGDLSAGWREYQWRASRRRFVAENPDLPLAGVLPEDPSGKRICLLCEQGIGDEIFFLRFAAALKARGAQITYAANPKLASILSRCHDFDQVIRRDDTLPQADTLMLLGDLPAALGETETPAPLTLSALPEKLQEARDRLSRLGAPPYVGLTWRAGTSPEQQRGDSWSLHKSFPVDALGAALRPVEGTLVALQRHPAPGEIERLAALADRPVHDLSPLNEDLEAMLALLATLDDYIAVSNTNVHLRAGTGRSARILLPQPPEWRWTAEGGESPWFPGFRIYRQAPDGGWKSAIEQLAQDLRLAPVASSRADGTP